jgi:transcriptional regulator with XRE-family HTH domain
MAQSVPAANDNSRDRWDPSVNGVDQLVGRGVRLLRERDGMSASTLASLLNVSLRDVVGWEAGQCRLPAIVMWQLATNFQVPVAFFLAPDQLSPQDDLL